MSATATPNHVTNGMTPPLPTAAELVTSLPAALKAEVLSALIRDLVSAEPAFQWFDVESETGERLGLFLKHEPEAAAADELYVSLPRELRLAVMKAELEFDWNDCMSEEEFLAPVMAADRKAQE